MDAALPLPIAGGGDLPAHVADPDPHGGYVLNAELTAAVAAHEAVGNPHPTYATDADLTAHVAAADPHPLYQLESASDADHITDATVTGKAAIRATDAAALTALINLATSALKGLVPAPGAATGRFLRDDLTYAVPAGGGGGATTTAATLTLPTARLEHSEVIADASATASSKIACWLNSTDDIDENDPEMLDLSTISGKGGSGAITFTATFREPTSGPVKILYQVL